MLQKPFREKHKIDDIFGTERSYGFHSGEDWNGTGGGNTDCGYKLYPVKNAELIHTSRANSGYGNVIIYKITGCWGKRWIRYCHCNEILVTTGIITKETPIATLGTSGNSTACHLHWDIIKKPMTNWRMYAKTKELLNEYFEEPSAFFNKYKDVPDENNMDLPSWFKTLLQEANLNLNNEGEFRAWWEKAKKYDEDVRTLQEQVKSITESLADRAREISMLVEENQKLRNRTDEAEEKYNKTRSELAEKDSENIRLNADNQTLKETNETLRTQVESLKADKPLYGYSWWERFVSLFIRKKVI